MKINNTETLGAINIKTSQTNTQSLSQFNLKPLR